MILTQCAFCAADLGLTLGKKCGRCGTRYCGPECQKKHWEEGGHDKLCKKIKKSGGAEQYHANTKYTEAVAVAAEKCAEDTKGQTCFICTQALHWKTKEGLVRGCSCRGTAGFAHVSCLAEQAKVLCVEGEENNLSPKGRWERWNKCSLCEQSYHGIVACALGWACWKMYLGRPETDNPRLGAMSVLGNGLAHADHHEEALPVQKALLSLHQRLGDSENILVVQRNLAITYEALRRHEEAIPMKRDVYFGRLRLNGEEAVETLITANNYATSLARRQRYKEAKTLMRKTMPVARRILGENCETTLKMRMIYARALYHDTGATPEDQREAMMTLEETERIVRRVLGGAHPLTLTIERDLQMPRAVLRAQAWALSNAEVERLPPAEKRAVTALRAVGLELAQQRGLEDIVEHLSL